jgi:hypothetical protein
MRLLSSPRRRRRAVWAGTLVVVAAVVAGVVAVFPGPPDQPGAASGPGWAPPKPEHEVRLERQTVAGGLAVADRFVHTAVARKNVAASWGLVVPSMREGFTRTEWANGEIPVVPYRFSTLRWRVAYTYRRSIGLEVALFPPAGSKTRPAVFNVDLRAVGSAAKPHWLVESFTPAVIRSVPPVAATGAGAGGTGLPNLSPDDGGPQRLNAVWLVVPFGVIALAMLVPVGLGVLNWRRGRQAERDWAERRARLS